VENQTVTGFRFIHLTLCHQRVLRQPRIKKYSLSRRLGVEYLLLSDVPQAPRRRFELRRENPRDFQSRAIPGYATSAVFRRATFPI
jgi:hypothetical protein